MAQKYVAPKFELLTKRTVEIPFTSIINTLTHLTLVSGMIPYPFRILQCKMIFTDDANNLVQHAWLTSGNISVSTTGLPSGDNIFGVESPTAVFIGKGIIRRVNTNIEFISPRLYIKLYTYNGLGYAYRINCSIIIQEL